MSHEFSSFPGEFKDYWSVPNRDRLKSVPHIHCVKFRICGLQMMEGEYISVLAISQMSEDGGGQEANFSMRIYSSLDEISYRQSPCNTNPPQ